MEPSKENIDAITRHLEQWHGLFQRMSEQVAPALRQQQELLQRAIQPIMESREKLEQSIAAISIQQERLQRIIGSNFPSVLTTLDLSALSQLTGPILNFQRSIQEAISPIFEQLKKSFSELPPQTKEALLVLGAHGWYLDLDMPIPSLWELRDALVEGNTIEAGNALTKYFENRIDDIEKSIINKFPHRKELLSSAFSAHRRGEYGLSIPVFLAQTDGICKDVTKQYFFRTHKGKPQTAQFVEEIAADTLRAALLSPLAEDLPIAAPESKRSAGWNELNRHMVMHGESLDYGNKVNGLKAISLINYVAHVLN
jgi:hypothetical protein